MAVILPQDAPHGISKLPVDERGYPVPWFVAWVDGKPEFRAADGEKFALAVKQFRCWVCGERLDRAKQTFVIGPMCSINLVSAEPPSHQECGVYSVKVCPFLSRPKAVRREAGMPDGTVDPAGEMIRSNPGVTLLYKVSTYEIERHHNGLLFRLPGKPLETQWYTEGRPATRAEVQAAFERGLPNLERIAAAEGESRMLRKMADRARRLWPAE